MANINDLDNLVIGEFDYLNWWDIELQKCTSYSDLELLYEEHKNNIDDNMWTLYNQRREELSVNPVDRIRNGELLKMRGTGGIYHAIQILANRNE